MGFQFRNYDILNTVVKKVFVLINSFRTYLRFYQELMG